MNYEHDPDIDDGAEEELERLKAKVRRIKVRKSWPEGLSPVTRVVPNKKIYKRQKFRLTDQDIYGV